MENVSCSADEEDGDSRGPDPCVRERLCEALLLNSSLLDGFLPGLFLDMQVHVFSMLT